MNASIIGIDCATKPNKVGLALASASGDDFVVDDVSDAAAKKLPAVIVNRWIKARRMDGRPIILALDAPLGWPEPLARELARHRAGEKVDSHPNALFQRRTDQFIRERTGKIPLEVGANLIARTAHAALLFLDDLRKELNEAIPLAWEPAISGLCAIEVYPAATAKVHGTLDIAGPSGPAHLLANGHVQDAMTCALAAHDFLTGYALPPETGEDRRLARKEGWIWVRDPRTVGRVSPRIEVTRE